jgi:hypothetical protein
VKTENIEYPLELPNITIERNKKIRRITNDNWIFTFGWIGSTNDQIKMNDGVVVIRLISSVRSSKPCPAASETAMIPT